MKYEWTTREYVSLGQELERKLHDSMEAAGWKAMWTDWTVSQKFVVYRREVKEITK
jgi:hypothetical protein